MSRRSGLKIVNSLYWILLSLWLGALVFGAVTAAIIFPTLRDLGVSLTSFSGPTDDHFMLAAGTVMDRVFFIVDGVQLVSSVGVAIILGLHLTVFQMRLSRPAHMIRALSICLLLLGVSYHLFVLAPRMNLNLQTVWSLREMGEDATEYRTAFAADHPNAVRLLTFNTVLLVVTITASACGLTTPDEPGNRSSSSRRGGTGRGAKLEEPELARKLGLS